MSFSNKVKKFSQFKMSSTSGIGSNPLNETIAVAVLLQAFLHVLYKAIFAHIFQRLVHLHRLIIDVIYLFLLERAGFDLIESDISPRSRIYGSPKMNSLEKSYRIFDFL